MGGLSNATSAVRSQPAPTSPPMDHAQFFSRQVVQTLTSVPPMELRTDLFARYGRFLRSTLVMDLEIRLAMGNALARAGMTHASVEHLAAAGAADAGGSVDA